MEKVRDTFRAAAPGTPNMRVNMPGQSGNGTVASDFARAVVAEDRYDLNYSDNGYDFAGEDSLGEPIKGFVMTSEASLAEKELERAGIRVQSLSAKRGTKKRNRRPTAIEFATLAEQFGDLMEIGESPTQVCRLLSFAQTNALLAEALMNASELIINGRSLSEAFAAQRDSKGQALYPVTFICALRIGEEVGATSDVESGESKSAFLLTLRRFAEAEKKADAIRSSIRSALMYPIAVVIFCIFAVGIVEYYVMPKMVELYNSLLTGSDTSLPLITRIMIGGSDLVTSWWGVVLLLGIVVGSVIFYRWVKSPAGSDWLKTVSLRLPVFGSFFRNYYAAQVLRTLAILASGIPSMTERFAVAARTTTNPEYAKMLMHVRHRFTTESTDLHKLFIPYPFLMGKEFGGVLMTFEKTADMQGTFHNYAKVVEVRAERELEKVLFWFQNFAIVPVGIFVGFIVAALYSPMFELAGRIGK
jgi:type IV pilus assembly protein PilC